MKKEIKLKYVDYYNKINKLFKERFGYDLFFIGGTLLGYVREGDFLNNDKDMDVAYFSKHSNVDSVKNEWVNIIKVLVELGENIEFVTDKLSIRPAYFWWKLKDCDLRIDVMVYWKDEKDNYLYRPTFVGYPSHSDLILPLKKEKFYGYDIFIPNKPELKLEKVYGKDWKTPNSSFIKKTIGLANLKDKLIKFKDPLLFEIFKKTTQWKNMTPNQRLDFLKKNKK